MVFPLDQFGTTEWLLDVVGRLMWALAALVSPALLLGARQAPAQKRRRFLRAGLLLGGVALAFGWIAWQEGASGLSLHDDKVVVHYRYCYDASVAFDDIRRVEYRTSSQDWGRRGRRHGDVVIISLADGVIDVRPLARRSVGNLRAAAIELQGRIEPGRHDPP